MSSNHRLLAAPPSRSPESPHFLRPVKKFHSDPHAAAGLVIYFISACFSNLPPILPVFCHLSNMPNKNFLWQKGPGAVCHFICCADL